MESKVKNKKIIITIVTILLIIIIISSLVFYLINKDKNKEVVAQLSDFEKVTLNSYLNNDLMDKNLIKLLDTPEIQSPTGSSYYALVCYFTQYKLATSVDFETLETYAKNTLNLSIDTMSLSNLATTGNEDNNQTIEKSTVLSNVSNSNSVLGTYFNEMFIKPDGSYRIVADIVKLNSDDEIIKCFDDNPEFSQEIYNQQSTDLPLADNSMTNDNMNSEVIQEILSSSDKSNLLTLANYKYLSTPLCTMEIVVIPTSTTLQVESVNFIDVLNQQ